MRFAILLQLAGVIAFAFGEVEVCEFDSSRYL